MNSKKALLATLLTMAFAPAFAAEAEPEPARQARPHVVVRDITEVRALEGMRFMGHGMRMHGKAVKGMPYSAEVVSERQQHLADGNQIVRKTSSMSYRDGAGRTRQELRDDKGEVLTITIQDGVDGTAYLLNPRTKTATRLARHGEIGKAAGEAARARIEQLRKEGKLPIERREIIIRHGDGPDAEKRISPDAPGSVLVEAPDIGRDMRVRLGPLAGAFGDMKWSRKATTKDLGTRDIEGVKAEGKLRSYEIPAGEVGNRYPIVVSDESWYSPELQVTVLSKHSDPRSGDNTYRLANIKREEPAPALFTVPSDYTVKDVMANAARVIEKKAP
ncbi:MAG: hypothetical protein ABWY27_01665 [Telluria sp.]